MLKLKTPGANDNRLSIALGQDGILWIGDYFFEKIVRIDPRKLPQ